MKFKTTLLVASLMFAGTLANAQLSKNPNKFLGNITTYYQIDYGDYIFDSLWNQITPENESKWGSIEYARGKYNWSSCDKIYAYCKEHNVAFKFHTLLWGSQYPDYLRNLDEQQTLEAITNWFDTVAKRYPDLQYIDVANEAVGTHSGYSDTKIKQALGGAGVSGYDWLAKAFVMARDRWPNAILIYNDYNTFQWDTDNYINLLNGIKAAGGPVDAAGCQSHDVNDISGANFKAALEKIHDETGLPIFISELDIDQENDQKQLDQYKTVFPTLWEADYVAGVTLWGYIYGATWVDNSGLIRKNGEERPAFKWLKEYLQTDTAISAKAPKFDFTYAYAPTSLTFVDKEVDLHCMTYNNSEQLTGIELYLDSTELLASADTTMLEYIWQPIDTGAYTFVFKVQGVSSTISEKTLTITVNEPPKPYNGVAAAIPGVIETENFDEGVEGVAYHDNDIANQGGKYDRKSGVDVVDGNGGLGIGYTETGEWLIYTVDIAATKKYYWGAIVSSGVSNSAFRLYIDDVDITGKVTVPQTGSNNWDTYTTIGGVSKVELPAGTHSLKLTIEGSSCNIDKILFGEEPFVGIASENAAEFDGVYDVYSIMGVYQGTVNISNGDTSVMNGEYVKGIYILRKQGTTESHRVMVY